MKDATRRPTKDELAVRPAEQRALLEMADRCAVDVAGLTKALKATVLPQVKEPSTGRKREPTLGEVYGFAVVANQYQLNPFLKEIYAFPNKAGGMSPVIGVDGFTAIMNRHPEFDGIEFEMEWTKGTPDVKPIPVSCTATVHRKDRAHPIVLTEYLDECARNTDPWNDMPARMLRNRTLCQAVRVAFGVVGVMQDDEAETIRDVEFTTRDEERPERASDLGSIAKEFAESERARDVEPEEDDHEPDGSEFFAGLNDSKGDPEA